MYLSSCSFHNQLKSIHLNGKVNRRVDYFIHYLLQYEKDAFFRYKRDRQLPSAMNRKMKLEMSRHQQGLQIPTGKVQVSSCVPIVAMNKISVHFHVIGIPLGKGEQEWHVESVSGCNPDGYTVVCKYTTCPECSPQSLHDGVTCTAPECQFLCPHMYTYDKKQQWAYLQAHPQGAFSSS